MHPFLENRPITPPSGPTSNVLMALVGEQPGVEEVRNGRVFCGPAGRELDVELRMAEVNRLDCYITNVIKDLLHPLRYYISIPDKMSKVVEVSKEGELYIEALKQELEEVRPNVVVCVGAVSTYVLTSRRGIYRWRGSVVESTLIPGLKCIPTLHPATVIPPKSVFLNRYLIAEDLKKAKAESYTPNIRYVGRNRIIEPNYYETMTFLNICLENGRKGSVIDIDIEVVNEELSCISFAYDPQNAISIPFFGPNGNYWTVEQEADIMMKIAEIYEDGRITKRGQNHIFDANFLLSKYGIRFRGEFHDTMIAQKILFPDFKADLGFITTMYTDIPYYKDDGKKWMKVGGPWEEFWNYNANDSLVTAEAGPKQLKDLELQGNIEVYDRQRKVVSPLLYMQERGIRVDVDGMKKEAERTEDLIREKEQELWERVGYSINYNSPKQLMEYFYEQLGVKPYKKRNSKGQYVDTTDENALKRLAKGTSTRPPYPEAQMILDLRGLVKRRSTYLELNKIDRDGRYRSAYKPVGAKTGRLASGETIFGTGGNQQNWPHDLLKYLCFDDGYLGYSIDLSQAETRVVAYVGNVTQMIEAFENNMDIHRLTASLIFNKPYDEISDEDGSSSFGNGTKSERYWGKQAGHSLNYDKGYKSFALDYELLEKEAKFIVDRYYSGYPGIKNNYHAEIRRQLFENRTITNLMGRKRLFLNDIEGVVRGLPQKVFREAYNHMAQSTVADVINEWGVNYIYYNQDEFGPVELLTQIHDSVVFQIPLSCPWKQHADILLKVCKKLETPLSYHDRTFTIPADVSVGVNMSKQEQVEIGRVSSMEVEELASKLEETYNKLKVRNI